MMQYTSHAGCCKLWRTAACGVLIGWRQLSVLGSVLVCGFASIPCTVQDVYVRCNSPASCLHIIPPDAVHAQLSSRKTVSCSICCAVLPAGLPRISC
jgi:hypothetical protein